MLLFGSVSSNGLYKKISFQNIQNSTFVIIMCLAYCVYHGFQSKSIIKLTLFMYCFVQVFAIFARPGCANLCSLTRLYIIS